LAPAGGGGADALPAGAADDVPAVGSAAGGAGSSADWSWTLVKPFSAGDPVSVSCDKANMDAKDIAADGCA